MDYKYNIISIDEKQRWIFLKADEWDLEEPDSFEYMLNKICSHVNGEVIDKGDYRYVITNDPCNLIYQWDTLFGITVIYPTDASKDKAVEFLKTILNEEELEVEQNG